MHADRSPKKSETLEVRIPYPTKTALMEKARAEGRAASEIVREQIDAYLAGPPPAEPLPMEALSMEAGPVGPLPMGPLPTGPLSPSLRDRAVALMRRNARGAALLLAGAGSAMAIGLAVSPATARPGLEAAVTTLDAEDAVTLAATDGKARAYLRYMLDTGTAHGVVPLTVVIDLPEAGVTGAELAQLVGATIDRLDGGGEGGAF